MKVRFCGYHCKDSEATAEGDVFNTSDLDPVYSPDQRRKKYSIIIIPHSAWRMGSPDALAMLAI